MEVVLYSKVLIYCLIIFIKQARKGENEYIKSPKRIVNKRATINPKNGDNKCFQDSITAALHYQDIKNQPERVTNIEPYICLYNWERIEFPAGIKDSKRFERNNKTIALNILFVPNNKKAINLAYKSKYNRKCKNQVVFLMITNGKKWHYIVLKSEPT